MATRGWRRLGDEFAPGANSFGFLRLLLAVSVLVAHCAPLGYGEANYGAGLTRNQVDLGSLGVNGFFVISGFLITASAMRVSRRRFAWHRFLRIFPGYWVCLVVTASVIAPLVALYERGTVSGLWTRADSPAGFVLDNLFTGIRQWGISGLLTTTPYGAVFNGSLWSLVYELICYAMAAALAWTGVLRAAPRLLLVATAAMYALTVVDVVRPATGVRGTIGPLPLLGALDLATLHLLVMLFLAGACAHLYRHRIPMHPAAAATAAAAFVASAALGGFAVVGLPAYAYLLLWAACRLPRVLHGVGRANDYSYGVYIYAFPVQQVIALTGGTVWGPAAYIGLSLAGTLVLAFVSWHLVEKPALSLKNPDPVRSSPEAEDDGRPVATSTLTKLRDDSIHPDRGHRDFTYDTCL